MNQEIKDLRVKIAELNIKIDDIQNECSHIETTIVDYQWRIGSTVPAIMCTECEKIIKLK